MACPDSAWLLLSFSPFPVQHPVRSSSKPKTLVSRQDEAGPVPGPGGRGQRQAGVLRRRQPGAGLPVVAHRRGGGGGGGGRRRRRRGGYRLEQQSKGTTNYHLY